MSLLQKQVLTVLLNDPATIAEISDRRPVTIRVGIIPRPNHLSFGANRRIVQCLLGGRGLEQEQLPAVLAWSRVPPTARQAEAAHRQGRFAGCSLGKSSRQRSQGKPCLLAHELFSFRRRL